MTLTQVPLTGSSGAASLGLDGPGEWAKPAACPSMRVQQLVDCCISTIATATAAVGRQVRNGSRSQLMPAMRASLDASRDAYTSASRSGWKSRPNSMSSRSSLPPCASPDRSR